MKLVSVNVGLPRVVERNGEPVSTGIFKSPVSGKVKVNQFNLEGDGQADLTVHGGWSKAVYAYPFEHYDFWREHLPDTELPLGIFGENLTITGILENDIFIGDKLRIGTAEFVVTEPRFPCFKLGIRFNRPDMVLRFHLSGRNGFYMAIEKTGEMEAGDEIEIIHRDANRVSIADIVRLKNDGLKDIEIMRRAVNVEALPEKMKQRFLEKLAE